MGDRCGTGRSFGGVSRAGRGGGAPGRSLAPGLALAALLLAAPETSASVGCEWVYTVPGWRAALSWDWQHHAEWGDEWSSQYTGAVSDAGSGSSLLPGLDYTDMTGNSLAGTLAFDDHVIEDPPEGDDRFVHVELSGGLGPASAVALYVDTEACQYAWVSTVYGSGTQTTDASSGPLEDIAPNQITSGAHPIPSSQGALESSDRIPVQTLAYYPWTPVFMTMSGTGVQSANELGEAQLGSATVRWSFRPTSDPTPLNDTCHAAQLVTEVEEQDVSLATNSPADPTSSCGAGDRSVWFLVVAPATGTLRLSTAGSGFATVVSAWPTGEDCDDLVTEVACGAGGAEIPATKGQAYLVQVERASGDSGSLHLAVPEPAAPGVAALAALAALGARARRASATSPATAAPGSGTNSTAPASQAALSLASPSRGRVWPRWSKGGQSPRLPLASGASIAARASPGSKPAPWARASTASSDTKR